jgi:hypothetical protein
MRAGVVAGAVVVALAAGCGDGGGGSPEEVVRGWSDAVNHGLNADAAAFFAVNAKVVQGRQAFILPTRAHASRFNASLPCQGKIVRLATEGSRVTATFLLDHRATFACNGVGTADTVVFTIRHGRIAVWERLEDGD